MSMCATIRTFFVDGLTVTPTPDPRKEGKNGPAMEDGGTEVEAEEETEKVEEDEDEDEEKDVFICVCFLFASY